MARATWLPDVLTDAGLQVVTHSGWETRGNDGLTPAYVMFHHTAGARGSDAPSLPIVIKGRPDLPGPLCHVLPARSGIMHVVASGVANHAGAGRYPDNTSGNRLSLAFEVENDGRGEPYPVVQLAATARAMAACCAYLNLGASRVIGHKEYTTRKIDPFGIDMNQWRRRVDTLLHDDQEDDMRPYGFKMKDGTWTYVTGGIPIKGIPASEIDDFNAVYQFPHKPTETNINVVVNRTNTYLRAVVNKP